MGRCEEKRDGVRDSEEQRKKEREREREREIKKDRERVRAGESKTESETDIAPDEAATLALWMFFFACAPQTLMSSVHPYPQLPTPSP